VRRSLAIANHGMRSVNVDTQARTCGVRAVLDSGFVPGRTTVTAHVEIDTTFFPEGETVKELNIRTNDPLTPSLLLKVRADVRSEVEVEPRVLHVSMNRPTAMAQLSLTPGSTATPTGIRTTDPRIVAEIRTGIANGNTVYLVTARTVGAQALSSWDLGSVVVATNSRSVPELRIPVRGTWLATP
jgi:hypothetical protein